mmetsp:Transcript_2177/g.5008  ORF Transcript_2177/g.5008 Transcript_2177/m.5008 type:complete len:258 (+) Transcript_2177:413-1186(+)
MLACSDATCHCSVCPRMISSSSDGRKSCRDCIGSTWLNPRRIACSCRATPSTRATRRTASTYSCRLSSVTLTLAPPSQSSTSGYPGNVKSRQRSATGQPSKHTLGSSCGTALFALYTLATASNLSNEAAAAGSTAARSCGVTGCPVRKANIGCDKGRSSSRPSSNDLAKNCPRKEKWRKTCWRRAEPAGGRGAGKRPHGACTSSCCAGSGAPRCSSDSGVVTTSCDTTVAEAAVSTTGTIIRGASLHTLDTWRVTER